MKNGNIVPITGLVEMNPHEMAAVTGGIDKKVKDVLYAIGYAIGYVASAIIELFDKVGDLFTKKS